MNNTSPTESELKSKHLEEFESVNHEPIHGYCSTEKNLKNKSKRKAKNKIAKASKKRNRK